MQVQYLREGLHFSATMYQRSMSGSPVFTALPVPIGNFFMQPGTTNARRLGWLGLLASILSCLPASAREPVIIEHVTVYAEEGRFGGWPANHGIWSWGNEILVGFGRGYYKDLGPDRHAIDRDRPEEHVLSRSTDGGHSWTLERPGEHGMLVGVGGGRHGTVPPEQHDPDYRDCPGGINFMHPDFALTVRMGGTDDGASRFYYSLDRGHRWEGPFRLPLFDQPGIAARTDYVVNGPNSCLLMLTASKKNSKEGRVICVQTIDGGKTWERLADVGDEPAGYAIMPATVRLGIGELLTVVRCREGDASWIDAYASHDHGQKWEYVGRPVPDTGEGNPPALNRLADGRLCLTYGYRAAPFAIHARMSRDGGKTWGEPFVLRGDGVSRDLGYPRTIVRPDGKLVTVYYFHDASRVERTIQATIWDPGI